MVHKCCCSRAKFWLKKCHNPMFLWGYGAEIVVFRGERGNYNYRRRGRS